MTDLNNWRSLVHIARIRTWDPVERTDHEPASFVDYVLVPLTPYQIGNLLDALTQATDTGDWYWEFVGIAVAAMEKAGINELTSNRGRVFKLASLRQGNLYPDHDVVVDAGSRLA